MTSLILPTDDGGTREYRLQAATSWTKPTAPLTARRAYAAAHVIPEVSADNTPGAPAQLDWDATLAYRHELWSYGLGVADAMDTAQRGMGLDWAATQQLIKRTGTEAASVVAAGNAAIAGKSVRDLVSCGAGTDQLDITALPEGAAGIQAVIDAYREQIAVVSEAGPKVILMASRALAKVANGADDYLHVYSTLLQEVDQPVILHWLGTMFDPALAGYWGSDDVSVATETFLSLIREHSDKVDGVKVSLLDASHEVALRANLPEGVRLYTGDDFNYPELIDGDQTHHSDALLGIFAAIYPAASVALQKYDAGQGAEGRAILDSTRELGKHIFSAPTFYYKTGIAFMSWLNGKQPGFQMVGGLHSGRSVLHLAKTFELADQAGLLKDPSLAAFRMSDFLRINGVGA
ncbi:dihydrodipicolinate synthase family protein [Paenarthrobacter sp. MSM-2-10-13]|uniref:dihydrodipicolinate synthase family protein n=1 Tax=unclassified Paenarthrobacter TaxID=2634190 RepID=UPI001423537E|nr:MULTISPECIES: dihydrodipicolinate synthase family protein [unclassified Paenarthrobacter]MCM0616395.1 dihydrodipicolinate synthase family protein [Paenarthrobacter sp. TYUT067]NHW48041.1 dihydrodipicolinate synthase family protein [Paenarthrobacter sp. MSM-2-10-13]